MDHPTTPIVVVSPILRPDAEDASNKLGATLADIRHAIESVTRERIVAGDATLSLVAGAGVISAEHLADGIHPGDEGHKRIAAAVAKALTTAMREDAVGAEALTESLPASFGMTVISGGRSERDDKDELPVVEDGAAEVDGTIEEEAEEHVADEDSEVPAEASLS
jgi:hypothetical protein